MRLLFRGELVTAVWTAVRVLEPLLNTLVSENMFARGQPKRCLVDALWAYYAIIVVANDAS